ncbi:STAS domain-containing protein [Streptomyces monticola]|uniref:STAS domain-containing protein n=1 Tax=Streptomyces monticola TaxID=2666263 RepID=A0ABW2JD86_9ACTN
MDRPQARLPADPRLTVVPVADGGEGALTLALSGELDVHTVDTLCAVAISRIHEGRRHLRLDFTQVTWCDNASLFALLGLRAALHAADGSLGFTAFSKAIDESITRNGLGHEFRP